MAIEGLVGALLIPGIVGAACGLFYWLAAGRPKPPGI
jgi:hypothetical protein